MASPALLPELSERAPGVSIDKLSLSYCQDWAAKQHVRSAKGRSVSKVVHQPLTIVELNHADDTVCCINIQTQFIFYAMCLKLMKLKFVVRIEKFSTHGTSVKLCQRLQAPVTGPLGGNVCKSFGTDGFNPRDPFVVVAHNKLRPLPHRPTLTCDKGLMK